VSKVDILENEIDRMAEGLDITLGDDEGSGGAGLDITLDPCKCPDTHETASGQCDQFLPEVHGQNRIRCDGCQRDGGWIHKGTKAKKDRPPVDIKIDLGKSPKATKLEPDQQRVLEAATAWLTMIGQGMAAFGDETCPKALAEATPQIAQQLAILSKFHPMIVKVLCPIEATGEGLAWISLTMALAPVVLVVLVHHKVISEEQAKTFGVLTMVGAIVNAQPEAPAAEAA
jgi:hypothetical protein